MIKKRRKKWAVWEIYCGLYLEDVSAGLAGVWRGFCGALRSWERPIGVQCFKFAALSFFPFGKEVVYGGGAVSLLMNIVWLLVSGIPLAIEHAVIGILLCITVVGIPFGLQQFKLAKLALMPFGANVIG